MKNPEKWTQEARTVLEWRHLVKLGLSANLAVRLVDPDGLDDCIPDHDALYAALCWVDDDPQPRVVMCTRTMGEMRWWLRGVLDAERGIAHGERSAVPPGCAERGTGR